jgi:hypothetical protein
VAAAGVGVAALLLVAVAVPRLDAGGGRTVTTSDPAGQVDRSGRTGDPTTTVTTDATSVPTTTAPPGTAEAPPDVTASPDQTTPDPTDGDGEGAEGPGGPADGDAGAFSRPPLWPFRSWPEVQAWQEAYRTQGTQPWHLDAEQTAVSFTTGFLGFTDIDQVVTSEIGAADAHVTVGYVIPGETTVASAAVVHLVRFGTGDDAPWEVVGTRDTDLTLDTPRYGSTVASPLAVGGTISGVDESLRVQVRQPSSSAPLGESCCVSAGGERQPWSASVTFSGASDPALTVVVSTGGHAADVERFAITAVRP